MANSKIISKTNPSNEDSTLQGYVHLLSTVKTANVSAKKYFECKLQTKEDQAVRLVCYSPEKRVNLQQAFLSKSPVKIVGAKRQAESQDYTIAKACKISDTSLEFGINEALGSRLFTVKECLTKPIYETMDLKIKVMMKSESKQAIIHNGQTKYKVDGVIADSTHSMKIALWEEAIDKVQTGHSYQIENVKLRIFDDTKFVNTNEDTVITEIDDIGDVDLTSPEIANNIITAQCVGVDVKKSSTCIACNATIQRPESDSEMVTCFKCKITTLAGLTKSKLVCQLLLKTDNKIVSYTCFNGGIDSFLVSSVQNSSTIPVEDLKRLLLTSGTHRIIVDKARKVIAQFLS